MWQHQCCRQSGRKITNSVCTHMEWVPRCLDCITCTAFNASTALPQCFCRNPLEPWRPVAVLRASQVTAALNWWGSRGAMVRSHNISSAHSARLLSAPASQPLRNGCMHGRWQVVCTGVLSTSPDSNLAAALILQTCRATWCSCARRAPCPTRSPPRCTLPWPCPPCRPLCPSTRYVEGRAGFGIPRGVFEHSAANPPSPDVGCNKAVLLASLLLESSWPQGLPGDALPPALAFRAGRRPDNTSLVWKARRLQVSGRELSGWLFPEVSVAA